MCTPKGRGVVVEIENPGPFKGPRPGGEGLGLVEKRLAHAYGDAAALTIFAHEGSTRARIVLSGQPHSELT